ncbi:Hypothetical predicted protein [Mytilus galloprovincialis]|uniref:Uncharacterized protein n=1 Tax=Mytilus galloprovincialis TaxID=29158 RepID=A0A8B6EPV3_MYTGA|nr:Hypothetical predicted protein [Mytilus galloprovincialis]
MELSKKLRGKNIFSEQDNVNNGQLESDDQVMKEKVGNSPSDYDVSDIDDNMSSTHSSSVTSENYDMEDNMSVNSVKIENNQKSTDIGANDTKLEEPVMKWWWFSLVLFGLTSQFIVKENVMFQKIKEIATTRSNWLITFVVDLEPFELFLNKIEQDLGKALLATQKVYTTSMFYTPEKKHILATILSLQREVEGLNRTRDYLHSQFNDYKSLHYDETAKFRTKRSLFPIIGKALSFLFGTVSDSDLSKIRRNIKTLAQNQDAIRHIVQDGLTILNTTQTHVSENRHKVNELIESVEELGNRLQIFATDIKIQIEVMGSYL